MLRLDAAGHSLVSFVIPEGSGLRNQVRLRAGNQISNELLLDYGPPRIFADQTTPWPLLAGTAGGTPVTLRGRNFGAGPGAGIPGSFVVMGNSVVNATSWTHDEITFQVPEG